MDEKSFKLWSSEVDFSMRIDFIWRILFYLFNKSLGIMGIYMYVLMIYKHTLCCLM